MSTSIKCLVTGGAGFIGSHLCEELIEKGYEVYAVDNLVTGSKKNIAHLQKNTHFHFISHDVINPFPINLQFPTSNFQFIYHLASPASPPQYQKYAVETMLTNSIGTYNCLELVKKSNAVFILASTSEIYGDPQEHPQKESYYGYVNPVGIRACYDESKRFAEAITMEYKRKFKVRTRIIRIFNTYGPRMMVNDGRVISNFVNAALNKKPLKIYGDGLQTRSFCYVSDMVDGLIRAAETEGIDGEVLNLGNPVEKSIIDIGKIILELTHSNSPVDYSDKQEDDPVRRKPDISRAKRLLKWEPNVNLTEGLNKTIDYYKKI